MLENRTAGHFWARHSSDGTPEGEHPQPGQGLVRCKARASTDGEGGSFVSILWIILIIVIVLALLGFLGRGAW
jgi:hypothetical protein